MGQFIIWYILKNVSQVCILSVNEHFNVKKNFNQEYGWIEKLDRDPLRQRLIRRVKDKNNCGRNCLWAFLCSILPILQWLPKYSWRKNIVVDIMGGLTVGVMSIPQGTTYGTLKAQF